MPPHIWQIGAFQKSSHVGLNTFRCLRSELAKLHPFPFKDVLIRYGILNDNLIERGTHPYSLAYCLLTSYVQSSKLSQIFVNHMCRVSNSRISSKDFVEMSDTKWRIQRFRTLGDYIDFVMESVCDRIFPMQYERSKKKRKKIIKWIAHQLVGKLCLKETFLLIWRQWNFAASCLMVVQE